MRYFTTFEVYTVQPIGYENDVKYLAMIGQLMITCGDVYFIGEDKIYSLKTTKQ